MRGDVASYSDVGLSSEMEKLLDLAENYSSRLEHFERVIDRYRLIQVIFLFFGVSSALLALSVYLQHRSSTMFEFQISAMGLATSILYIVTLETLVRRRRRKTLPDRLALGEILRLVRETEAAVAESEHWSTLKRAEFRIRLSRFEIGDWRKSREPSKSMFN